MPTNTSMPLDFLLQQIEQQERLEDIHQAQDPETEMDTMAFELQTQASQLETEFAQAYSSAQFEAAETAVRKLQFIVKLQQQLNTLEGVLLD